MLLPTWVNIWAVVKYAGVDCTKQFNDAKHIDVYNYMNDLCIGKVKF
jgi:cytochrome b involved in lipid metabolism